MCLLLPWSARGVLARSSGGMCGEKILMSLEWVTVTMVSSLGLLLDILREGGIMSHLPFTNGSLVQLSQISFNILS